MKYTPPQPWRRRRAPNSRVFRSLRRAEHAEKKARYDRMARRLEGWPPERRPGPVPSSHVDECSAASSAAAAQRVRKAAITSSSRRDRLARRSGLQENITIPREKNAPSGRARGETRHAPSSAAPATSRKVLLSQGFFRIQQTCNRCGGRPDHPGACPVSRVARASP